MNNYKTLMVALDFSETDKSLVKYVSFLSAIIKPSRIYFIHFLNVPEFPDVIRDKQEDYLAGKCREQMISTVSKNFPNLRNFQVEYTVLEGTPLTEMLRWSGAKKIDLIVMGKKPLKQGSGLLAERMARKAGCSILLVPGAVQLKIENIFVASDFSENSMLALKTGWGFAQRLKTSKLVCYHTFHLPAGYYKSGKTEKDFQAAMLEHALNNYTESLRKAKIPADRVAPVFEMEGKYSAAKMINQAAHRQNADLIMVGAKGRNAVAAIFLGSVTEKLLRQDYDIPVLVVKEKGKHFSFIDFIDNI